MFSFYKHKTIFWTQNYEEQLSLITDIKVYYKEYTCSVGDKYLKFANVLNHNKY